MIQLAKYELMALDAMGVVVIERNSAVETLRIGAAVGLYVDVTDKNSDAEFLAKVVDVRSISKTVWQYTLMVVPA